MEFIYLPTFQKRLKGLAKKYPSIKKDISTLFKQLEGNPIMGNEIGKNCYKIRMAISSKGKGKSGGARVITCVKIKDDGIYFLTIYDKGEQETITDNELRVYIKYIEEKYR